jgi:hypothetical protein
MMQEKKATDQLFLEYFGDRGEEEFGHLFLHKAFVPLRWARPMRPFTPSTPLKP